MSGRSRAGIVALFTADGISILGTRMSALALPWFVLVSTGSAAKTGLVAFAEMLPYVLVAGLGGPLVDRIGARRVAIHANLVSVVLVGTIPVLHAWGVLSFGALLGLVAAVGAVRGASSATYVLVPGVADLAGTPIERATGLHDGVNRVAGMLGAPIAGVLLAVFSPTVVLAVDAATFLVAGVLVALFVPRTADPQHPDPAPSTDGEGEPQLAPVGMVHGYVRDLREGFGFLVGDRTLVAIALMVCVTNFLDQAMASVFAPVWVLDNLGSPLGLGLISLLFGLGAVTGSGLFAWLGPRLPRRQAYAWGFLVAGAPRFLALALASTLPPVLIIMLVAGVGVGAINPVLGAVEYERVPRHLQARVLGAAGALAWLGIPFGGLLGGFAVEVWGLTTALLVFGAAYGLATLAPFTLPSWRGLDRAEPDPETHVAANASTEVR